MTGDFLIKKLVLAITLISMLFSQSASAEGVVTLNVSDEFYIYGTDTKIVTEELGMTEGELGSYCEENGIVYLALNKGNTKQLRVSISTTDFSNGVVNISALSNDNIATLVPDIAGIEGAKGEIITKGSQKFIKLMLRSNDGGGDYILTQYITIADKRSFVLSFYTDITEDTDYTEEIFESFDSPLFLDYNRFADTGWHYVILIAAGIFAAVSAIIIVSIVKDIKNNKAEREDTATDEE